MSDKCEHCGGELDPQGDVALGKRLDGMVIWDSVADQQVGIPKTYEHNGGYGKFAAYAITVIAVSKGFGEDMGNHDREAFIIFVCDGFLMKKKGTVTSYGEVHWNGSCRSTIAKEQVKQMWERVQ